MNLNEHFPSDKTAHYVWQRLLSCQRSIRDGGRMSAAHCWTPHKTNKAIEIERAKAQLLAEILANSTQAGPAAAFYFITKADETIA